MLFQPKYQPLRKSLTSLRRTQISLLEIKILWQIFIFCKVFKSISFFECLKFCNLYKLYLKTFDRGYFSQQLILSLENPMNFCAKRRRGWSELLTNFSKILKLKNMKLSSETIRFHTRVWAGLTDFTYNFDSNKN